MWEKHVVNEEVVIEFVSSGGIKIVWNEIEKSDKVCPMIFFLFLPGNFNTSRFINVNRSVRDISENRISYVKV